MKTIFNKDQWSTAFNYVLGMVTLLTAAICIAAAIIVNL